MFLNSANSNGRVDESGRYNPYWEENNWFGFKQSSAYTNMAMMFFKLTGIDYYSPYFGKNDSSIGEYLDKEFEQYLLTTPGSPRYDPGAVKRTPIEKTYLDRTVIQTTGGITPALILAGVAAYFLMG